MTGADDILARLGADRTLAQLHGHDAEPVWEPPIPIGAGRALPPFPAAALPAWAGEMVAAVAEFTQTPADLPGCITLAVLSAAAGGRAVVTVRGGWSEPVNLFVVVAMPPASRKSAVFRAMTAPLLDAERQLAERVRGQIIEADLTRRIAKTAADKAAHAATASTDPGKLAEAVDAAVAADAVSVPPMPRLVADDITPERAAALLAEQGGRLAVLSAEGGIFATLAGRYSSVPNLEVFLKGHAGDMLRIDRQNRPAEHVDHPALTLGLAVQPEVIRDIAKMPGFRGKGLLGRILYSLPPSNIGRRRIGTEPVPAEVTDRYHAAVAELATGMHEWDDPARLQLTPEAAQALLDLEAATEPRLDPATGDLGHLGDWAGKYIGAVVRIAGLLHLAGNPGDGWRRPITAETTHAAAQLGDYFTRHAIAAYEAMGADPATEDARAVLAWLQRTKPASFTRRDVHQALRRSIAKPADLEPALCMLEEHGWIRRKPDQARDGPGRRPSPAYLTHPEIHGPGAQPPSTPPGH